jgi:hypothetical protein
MKPARPAWSGVGIGPGPESRPARCHLTVVFAHETVDIGGAGGGEMSRVETAPGPGDPACAGEWAGSPVVARRFLSLISGGCSWYLLLVAYLHPQFAQDVLPRAVCADPPEVVGR